MADASHPNNVPEPHPWAEMTPQEVLAALLYELYGPVSALGSDVDRLTQGAFEDDELIDLLDQMRGSVNHLSKLVVTLKRYTGKDSGTSAPDEPA